LIDVTIDGNRFDDLLNAISDATAIYVDMRNNTPNSNIRITNNQIGQGAIAGTSSGSVGGTRDGIVVQVDDATAKTMNLEMSGNSITVSNDGSGTSGDAIAFINADDDGTRLNATITNNTFNNSPSTLISGTGDVVVRSDAAVSAVCLDLSNNSGNQDVYVARDPGATYETEGTSGANATVAGYFNGINTINVIADGDGGGGFVNASCQLPPVAPTITPTMVKSVLPPAELEPDNGDEDVDLSESGMPVYSEPLPDQSDPISNLTAISSNASTAVPDFNLVVGDLPPAKAVTVKFSRVVNNTVQSLNVCEQGVVSGANFGDVLTDDPDVGGATDPTCTSLDAVLPVELASFSATVDGSRVNLTWSTASETNNSGFEIEHACVTCSEQAPSSDLATVAENYEWKRLDFVEGYGTTSEPKTYSFSTPELEPGRHAFRLKQVDFDGAFEYSQVVEETVEIPGRFVLEQAYPNPFNPSATIRFGLAASQQATVRMYDLHGRVVRTLFEGAPESGAMTSVRIDADGLASGTYVVRLETDGFAESRTVVLLK
jgi:hypothetical protein